MLPEFLSQSTFLLRVSGIWEVTFDSATIQLAYNIYTIILRYVAVCPTIILYILHIPMVEDLEVKFQNFACGKK